MVALRLEQMNTVSFTTVLWEHHQCISVGKVLPMDGDVESWAHVLAKETRTETSSAAKGVDLMECGIFRATC